MSETDDTPSNHSKTRRIRLPSPGTLLVGTLLLIACAVAIPIGMRYQRQQELIEHIELQGGSVETEDSAPAWVHDFLVRILGEDEARGFGEIVAVNFDSPSHFGPLHGGFTTVRDIKLQQLRSLEHLEELTINRVGVSEDEFQDLSALRNLKILDIRHSGFGDEALQNLCELENLEILRLQRTNFSDDAIEEFCRQLPNCEIDTAPLFPPVFFY